jgi:hypothetical protein
MPPHDFGRAHDCGPERALKFWRGAGSEFRTMLRFGAESHEGPDGIRDETA